MSLEFWQKAPPTRNRKPETRKRPTGVRKWPVRTFDCPDDVMNAFKAEIERPGEDGQPYSERGYGPAVVRLIADWLKTRGQEFASLKRGTEFVLHPAIVGCFA